MPQAIPAAIAAAKAALAAKTGLELAILAAKAAALVVTVASSIGARRRGLDQGTPRHDVTVRSTVAPRKIIYGTARSSGPIVYANVRPEPGSNNNSELWAVIAVAGHEVDSITDAWIDAKHIAASEIDAGGDVNSTSDYYLGGRAHASFYRRLGTDTQTAATELTTAFSGDWTGVHRGRGVAYVVTKLLLSDLSAADIFKDGPPRQYRFLVKGKKVYDPRLDSTNGGAGTHRTDDATTWEWSDNPALCTADYITDEKFGLGAPYGEINWPKVITAADICDASVSIPGGATQTRYTCNGVLEARKSHRENLAALVGCMNGSAVWTGGQWQIRAGAYEAPSITLTADDLAGDLQIKPDRSRRDRINSVSGTFVDPASDYAPTEFNPVTDTTTKADRDNGRLLRRAVGLNLTNNELLAQRIAFIRTRLARRETVVVFPCNLRGLQIAVQSMVTLTLPELGWTSKVFRCVGWDFSDEQIKLTLREEDSTTYDDPIATDYGVRSTTGEIVFGAPTVPSPTNLVVVPAPEGVQASWFPPTPATNYAAVELWCSETNDRATAVKVFEGRTTGTLAPSAPGVLKYFWARANDATGAVSAWFPTTTTTTFSASASASGSSGISPPAFSPPTTWMQISAGSWNPSGNTQDIVLEWKNGATVVASRTVRGTLDNAGADEGDIAVSTVGTPLNTTISTSVVTDSGIDYQISVTVTVNAGDADGSVISFSFRSDMSGGL